MALPMNFDQTTSLPLNIDKNGLRGAVATEIEDSPQFNRGWNSAGMSEDASAMLWKARNAIASGDIEGGAALERQGRDLMRQSQQWAPTVQNFTDINSAGSAVDWAGGAMGNVRSSIRPALGGLAGAAVGAVAAPFTGGVINPVTGARAGAFLAGYDQMTEAEAGKAMLDDQIRNTRSMDEIGNASRMSGVVQGALESIVPGSLAKSAVGLGTKGVRDQIIKDGVAKTIGKKALTEGGQEFATEFAQNPVGDVTQNYLREDPLDNIDWKGALNAGMAGMVAGGGMGIAGAGADVAHSKLQSGVESAGKAVDKVKADPLGTVLDAGVDLAAKAGTAKAKLENYFDERELKRKGYTQDEIDQGRLAQIQATLAGKSDLTSTSPFTEEENAMDAPSFNAHHEAKLKADAATILKAGRDSTEAEKSLAAQFAADQIDAVEFQTRLHQTQSDKTSAKETDALLTGLGQKSKKSEMRPSDRMYLESELLKPEAKQQKINTLTDIMVKQGVDEKIIKATNGEHNKLQLAGMLKWIGNGMNDAPEAVKAIVTRFGTNSSAVFKKAHGLATRNGLVKDDAEFAKDIIAQLDSAADVQGKLHKTLKDNLSDIALNGVQDVDGAVTKLVPMMKTIAQEGMSPRVKQGLIENFFGTEERLHNVINAYIDTGEHKKAVSKATGGGKEQVEIDADGNVVETGQYGADGELLANTYDGEGGSVIKKYDEDGNPEPSAEFDKDGERVVQKVKEPTVIGFTNPKGRTGVPFNLGFDKGIAKFEAVKAQHESEFGTDVVVAGIWDRTKKSIGADTVAVDQAGEELLTDFGPKLEPKGEYYDLIKRFAEGTLDIGDLSPLQKLTLLGQINNQFKYLEVLKADSGDSKHNIDDVEEFRWTTSTAKPETFTAQQGIIFLERDGGKGGKGVSNFPVKTIALFKQGEFTEKDGTNGTTLKGTRLGALGTSDLVMSGLTDLMLAETGHFTGRIGYRLKAGGELQWIENAERTTTRSIEDRRTALLGKLKAQLVGFSNKDFKLETSRGKNVKLELFPDELALGQYFDVGDAKAQATVELEREKSDENTDAEYESYKLPFATDLADKRKALLDLGVKLDKDIKEKIEEVIERFKTKYPTWQGDDAKDQLQLNVNRAVYRIGEKAGIYLRDPRQVIRHALQSGAPATNKLYTEMRNKFEGAVDGFGATPRSNDVEAQVSMRSKGQTDGVPAPSAAQGRIEAEDGTASVHRDDTGMRVGYGPDGWGAGVEGPASKRSREGTKAEARVLPSAAEVAKAKKEAAQPKALDKLENVKDRIIAALPNGVPALMVRRDAMQPEDRVIFDIAILGDDKVVKTAEVVATVKKHDDGVVSKTTKYTGDRFDNAGHEAGLADLSAAKLAALYKLDLDTAKDLKVKLTNAAKAIRDKISSLEESNASDSSGSGQGTVVGESRENNSGAANDKARNSAVPVVGQAEGTGNAGSSKTGVVEGSASEGVTLPKTSPYTAKDQAKSDKANKFIGQGSPRSSTAGYAKAWGAKANSGEYVATDRVFVSAEGARSGRKAVDTVELQKAIDAGATIITDDSANRNRPYNAGEREAADLLVANGYSETGAGIWTTSKQSTQQPSKQAKGKLHEQVAAANEHILKTVGSKIEVLFKRMANGSGEWAPGQHQNTIKLALNGDVLGAAFHESFHEFMDILSKNGGDKTSAVLQRAAMNPMIQRKLERLLNGHPEAIKQLADPEEAAAFMYQFWAAGLLKIGPETKSAFTTVKNFLKRVAGVFSETFRKEVEAMSREQMEAGHAELLMREFTDGAVANMDTRKMIVEAMEKNTELHNAAVERVGEAFQTFANTAGKMVFSNEAMMDATGNKHMIEIMRGFHQKVGTAMRKVGTSIGSYSDGLRQGTSQWVHKVENLLEGYSAADLELAREAMSKEVEPTDRVAKEIVGKINKFYADMAGYMTQKGVKRLNMERIDPNTGMKGVWEDIPLRKNYLSQVWSIDTLMDKMPEFKADLLKHHMKELQAIADDANKELKDTKGAKKGDAAKAAAEAGVATITPEMVADALGTRLLNSNGHIEISESNSGLGITPAATAVNKRELNWLDKDVFDKYKEKDLTSILTTYAHSIVKRGEFQSRFGPAGEAIADGADKAVLFELGGDALVDKAVKALPAEIEAWKKERAAAGDEEFTVPFPKLRAVGQSLHQAEVGQEKHDAAMLKAMGKLGNSFNAIQALEGTLGRDISANGRALNSWLVTYQSFRTLSTMLFTSFQDVAGVVVNGGEAKDAWNAFVEGIREIRNTVFDHKNPSQAVQDSEFWGTIDSGAYLESTAQAQGSPFMSGHAKAISDKFFKYTGAVGWNRGVRAVATQVAERIITGWKTNGVDMKDKAAVARFEDLFGKGADPASIKLNAEGRLDNTDAANQAAITRWVLTAVPAPTAAHRTIWMSDPHWAVFAQLKNYTYSFHRVMMKNAADQARLGNYRPAMAMMAGYIPIAIAAGAVKEMLIPGEEPPWMKGGLDGYLSYGFARAGVLGVPQMMLGSVVDASHLPGGDFAKAGSSFDPAGLAGPTVDQVQNILSIPFGEFLAMKDHTVIGEGLGALPGGNLLKRLERLGSA